VAVIWLPVLDTSVLLCGLAFPESDSGRLLDAVRRRELHAIVSDTIKGEAIRTAILKAPELASPVAAFIDRYTHPVTVTSSSIELLQAQTGDRNDSHVLAASLVSGEQWIYTLDLGFFTGKMKKVTHEHGIRAVFPSFTSWFGNPLENIEDLPTLKPQISTALGTVTLTIITMWASQERQHIDKPWYVLDAPSVFGLWYDTRRQGFKFLPYALGNEHLKFIGHSFEYRDAIRVTVAYSADIGFDIYINEKERHCCRYWVPPAQPQQIYVGSSSTVTDHMNCAYQGMRTFGEYLPQRIIRIMHEFDQISVSDKDLEIVRKHRWILLRPPAFPPFTSGSIR
jgi:predicted nucleic acid-binding protein